MKPLVSVIITVYERADYLESAIRSVINQSFQDFEIIIAADSECDDIYEICKKYLSYDNIRYRANVETMGVALNLRSAISEAKGTYISILNDDDEWEENFLEYLVSALESNDDSVLAFSDHWIMNENSEVDQERTEVNTKQYGRHELPEGALNNTAPFVLEKNGVPLAMASVFRKDYLDRKLLTPEVAGAYDFWISCLLSNSGRAFYYVTKRLTRYRVHSQMETARRSPDKSKCMVYIFRSLYEGRYFPALKNHLKNRLAGALYHHGRDKLYFNLMKEARSCFRESLKYKQGWKPLLGFLLSYQPLGLRKYLGLSQ